ncbi:MAG TPA: hypothetical protein VLV16_14110 [Gemmatimonadales bacterium]|nr:hypothetical protein [Gemmatimonadales bacterium]
MLTRLVLAVVVYGTLCAAPLGAQSHRWSHVDVALAASATVGLLIDWSQTSQAMQQGWVEANPILGRRPTLQQLTTYNLVALSSTLGVGAVLPSRWRSAWFAGIVAVEVYAITGNAAAGLHVGF